MSTKSGIETIDLLKATKVPPMGVKSCPICHKIFSKFVGQTHLIRHIESCRKKKLLASLPSPLRNAVSKRPARARQFSKDDLPNSHLVHGPVSDGGASNKKHQQRCGQTLNMDLVSLARDRAVPLQCLTSGVGGLGKCEEVNKHRVGILQDAQHLVKRIRQLALETRPASPTADLSWIDHFPRVAMLWDMETYISEARVPLAKTWQRRCRHKQWTILDLDADPRCVVALSILDLSNAFTELETRARLTPQERVNARRRLERKRKAKAKSRPVGEPTTQSKP